jgi:hypothetical protein
MGKTELFQYVLKEDRRSLLALLIFLNLRIEYFLEKNPHLLRILPNYPFFIFFIMLKSAH